MLEIGEGFKKMAIKKEEHKIIRDLNAYRYCAVNHTCSNCFLALLFSCEYYFKSASR